MSLWRFSKSSAWGLALDRTAFMALSDQDNVLTGGASLTTLRYYRRSTVSPFFFNGLEVNGIFKTDEVVGWEAGVTFGLGIEYRPLENVGVLISQGVEISHWKRKVSDRFYAGSGSPRIVVFFFP